LRLEVLVGMIASGKSTYARRRADEGALVVSHDDLTAMLHARYRYEQGLREPYRRIEESIAWRGLDAGRDVVIDRTHLTRESRERWLKWVRGVSGSLSVGEGRCGGRTGRTAWGRAGSSCGGCPREGR
jgi:predicted kinase